MGKILKDMYYSLYYLWTKDKFGKDCIEESRKYSKSISKVINDNVVTVVLYHNYIVEHVVKSKDRTLYYIHFEFKNFNSSTRGIEDLLDFANSITSNVRKALFCCTSGITSSLFAQNMQEYINKRKVDLQTDACDINSLSNKSNDYDVVILTPQIHYCEQKIKEKINTKVIKISTKDFASNNFRNVLSLLDIN